MEVLCPYCGRVAEFVDSKVIYGKSYGMIYLCAPCDAYVGCHKGTNKPLGRLANKELRRWKTNAHNVFDNLWKSGKMPRTRAYEIMQQLTDLPADEAHIGKFDVEQCKKLIREVKIKFLTR